MRNVPPFRCAGCGAESDYSSQCEECEQPYLDALGQPAVRPPVQRRNIPAWSPFTWLVGAVAVLLTIGGALLERSHFGAYAALAWTVVTFLGPARSLWRWIRSPNHRYRRRAKEAVQRAALEPIARAADGICRIRGRVRVLRSAPGEDARVGAAFRRVRSTHSYVEVRENRSVTIRVTSMTDTAECGRFAVIDESGVAIVDDDAFMVWTLARRVPSERDAALLVEDGDVVEVVGPARRGHDEDAAGLHAPSGAYRDGPPAHALIFDGRPDNRVWILVS